MSGGRARPEAILTAVTRRAVVLALTLLLAGCASLLPDGLTPGVRAMPRDAATECPRSDHTMAVVIADDIDALRRLFPTFGLAPELDGARSLTVTVNDAEVPIPQGIVGLGGGLERPNPTTVVLCIEAGELNWYPDVSLEGSPYQDR